MYTAAEIKAVNKTARTAGAVGSNPLVPRYVRQLADKYDLILDFGAGPTAKAAMELREEGFNVVPYEFGENFDPNIHDADALTRLYDVVYASNVLNVQPSFEHIMHVIAALSNALDPNGILIANYPKPRKFTVHFKDIKELFEERFDVVDSDRYKAICICRKPKGFNTKVGQRTKGITSVA